MTCLIDDSTAFGFCSLISKAPAQSISPSSSSEVEVVDVGLIEVVLLSSGPNVHPDTPKDKVPTNRSNSFFFTL